MINHLRFAVGRWLIHAGLRVMPEGKVRRELSNLFFAWGVYVVNIVKADRMERGG